jgi:hypothetical protein
MSNARALQGRIKQMLEAIEQRVEAAKPTYGLILYKPIHCEPPYHSEEEHRASIMAEQPAVQEKVELLRSQGVHTFFWLPDNGRDGYLPDGYAA